MTFAFLHAHFGDMLARCITNEAVSGVRVHQKSLDDAWRRELKCLTDILDCIEVVCPG